MPVPYTPPDAVTPFEIFKLLFKYRRNEATMWGITFLADYKTFYDFGTLSNRHVFENYAENFQIDRPLPTALIKECRFRDRYETRR